MSSVTLFNEVSDNGDFRVCAEWHKDRTCTVTTYENDGNAWRQVTVRHYTSDLLAVGSAKRKFAKMNKESPKP
ncbi:hypothetical protein AEAC466_04500 [Asticcacaulis sp. AC466]|uniref:hypothetical protein n=1 Tax=Asticcacaulis sp. AC466 TaxID=1282362 RepID=UPI0003C3DA80|nr:hypothetical protein [Asticcacaulis sp. AC466]ESQ85429.1 hypothetical protein AEAC466_04500 [Asticcacaulis sp. AC466]